MAKRQPALGPRAFTLLGVLLLCVFAVPPASCRKTPLPLAQDLGVRAPPATGAISPSVILPDTLSWHTVLSPVQRQSENSPGEVTPGNESVSDVSETSDSASNASSTFSGSSSSAGSSSSWESGGQSDNGHTKPRGDMAPVRFAAGILLSVAVVATMVGFCVAPVEVHPHSERTEPWTNHHTHEGSEERNDRSTTSTRDRGPGQANTSHRDGHRQTDAPNGDAADSDGDEGAATESSHLLPSGSVNRGEGSTRPGPVTTDGQRWPSLSRRWTELLFGRRPTSEEPPFASQRNSAVPVHRSTETSPHPHDPSLTAVTTIGRRDGFPAEQGHGSGSVHLSETPEDRTVSPATADAIEVEFFDGATPLAMRNETSPAMAETEERAGSPEARIGSDEVPPPALAAQEEVHKVERGVDAAAAPPSAPGTADGYDVSTSPPQRRRSPRSQRYYEPCQPVVTPVRTEERLVKNNVNTFPGPAPVADPLHEALPPTSDSYTSYADADSTALCDGLDFYALADGLDVSHDLVQGGRTPVVVFSGGTSVCTQTTTATADTPPQFVSTRSGTPSQPMPDGISLPPSHGHFLTSSHEQERTTVRHGVPPHHDSDAGPTLPASSVTSSNSIPVSSMNGAGAALPPNGCSYPVGAPEQPPQQPRRYFFNNCEVLPPAAFTYTYNSFLHHAASMSDHETGANTTHDEVTRSPDASPSVEVTPSALQRPPSPRVAVSVETGRLLSAAEDVRTEVDGALSTKEREMLLRSKGWLFPFIEGAEDL